MDNGYAKQMIMEVKCGDRGSRRRSKSNGKRKIERVTGKERLKDDDNAEKKTIQTKVKGRRRRRRSKWRVKGWHSRRSKMCY